MKPRENGQENFVMVFEEITKQAGAALVEKRLQPRDLALLLLLLGHMNWRSGRIRITAAALAEESGSKHTNVYLSLKRLQQELFLVRVWDRTSGDKYILINPRLVSVGSPSRRAQLFQEFEEALE